MKKYGLAPAMMTGAGTTFQDGLIRKELHDKFEAAFKTGIDTCASVGCPNLIAMPGEKRGMSRDETVANTVAILNRVKGYAEQKNVTLCMEITNSKVAADQRTDQTFNHLDWGWEVCKKVGSPRVKIVYDIYHVQIMDGDVVRNLRENLDLHLPHPHRRRAQPTGDRRHAGTELPLHRQRHRRVRIHRLRRARASAGTRAGCDQKPRGVFRDSERFPSPSRTASRSNASTSAFRAERSSRCASPTTSAIRSRAHRCKCSAISTDRTVSARLTPVSAGGSFGFSSHRRPRRVPCLRPDARRVRGQRLVPQLAGPSDRQRQRHERRLFADVPSRHRQRQRRAGGFRRQRRGSIGAVLDDRRAAGAKSAARWSIQTDVLRSARC